MNDNAQYDVAIIGGGLAGLTLAIQCAQKSYSVVLFEKEAYPFHKVCGEYISNESRSFLESLGVPLTKWNVPVINKLQASDVKGNAYYFDLPLGGFGVSRYQLDDELYRLAVSQGVQVLTSTKVSDVKFANDMFEISASSKIYTAKIAAGCFGKRSNLDVKLNRSFIQQKHGKLNNYIGIKYHVRYPQQHNIISLHNFKNGYCGISQIEDGKCCLCYLTTAHNLLQSNNSISQMEQKILWQNPHLKKIFTSAEFLYEQPLAISQISFSKKAQVQDHILMIGDSAGMITPLCGNGMSMAMHAGKIAFTSIENFLSQKTSRAAMEDTYTKKWQHHFSRRLFTGRLVQRMLGTNSTTSLFLKLMNAMPGVAKAVIRSTHGDAF